VLDVYGVTIPGAPGIIIGFNRDVAWTFTNTQADVVDYFSETVDDEAAPSHYLLDGAMVPLELRVERHVGPDGGVIATDTVRFTHRGPLRRVPALAASGVVSKGRWVSMRWTLLDPSRETSAFIDIMKSRSVADWMAAMASYRVPAQNMLVADRAGTIGIRSTGTFPRRAGDGRGDVIRDGSRRGSDWTGSWPVEMYPQSMNPVQGFLASANQQPVDPKVNPSYLGTGWFPPWRAMRINALLRDDSAVTPDAMRRYQTDPGSARAEAFVPAFLAAARSAGRWAPLDSAARLLSDWDRRYTVDNERAVLFEYAMDELGCALWDELLSCGRTRRGGPRPDDMVLLEVLADSASVWWDVRETPNIETRDEIVANSLARGFTRAVTRHGPPSEGGWRWSAIRQVNVGHLAGIPAFSAAPVPALGGPSTLSPSSGSGTHGASWRMVVELGPEVRAWATYPGGQSGNPLSDRYADRLPTWAAGQLDTLRFPRSSADLGSTGIRSTLALRSKR
jgi:penicillin amidase